MMAVDEKKRVLLVRQYRLPAEKYLWELPAGRLDRRRERRSRPQSGNSPKRPDTRRGSWTKLVSFCASPGYVQERMTIFLAEDLTAGKATPMDDEQIETGWFTRRELNEMIAERQDSRTPRP